MFCPNCGKDVDKNADICTSCGKFLKDKPAEGVACKKPVEKSMTNVFALSGFIMSLVSVLFSGLLPFSLVAASLSVVGILEAKKKNGKSYAIAGLIIALICVVWVISRHVFDLPSWYILG